MIMDDHRWFSLNHSLVKLPQNHFSNRLVTVQLGGTTSKTWHVFPQKDAKKGMVTPT